MLTGVHSLLAALAFLVPQFLQLYFDVFPVYDVFSYVFSEHFSLKKNNNCKIKNSFLVKG